MGLGSVRVVIATTQPDFFKAAAGALAPNKTVEATVHCMNIRDVERQFNRLSSNIVLFDIEGVSCPYEFLKQLIERHRVYFIITGTNPMQAAAYLKGSIKDYIPKPLVTNQFSVQNFIRVLESKISLNTAAPARLSFVDQQKTVDSNQKIVAIASSTGGTDALEKILKKLPKEIPPILIVQHMTSGFTKLFADRLNNIYPMEIKEAANNDFLRKGLILIAPTDHHMTLVRRNGKLSVECFRGKPMHGVMPAADVLFESIAPIMRSNVVGVVLTGMGADGAKGLLRMRSSGAKTIGQNKETCVVYGMPKVAYDIGAVEFVLPLEHIADKIMSLA